jgi:predicted NAD-dependent protein-ADP-ribosyltransferase YbiA (DUF1768 family)
MPTFTTFTKSKLPNGWLGNMSGFPIVHEGITFRTNEHLFQWLRFADENIKKEIVAQRSPMAVKFVAKRNADKMVVEPMGAVDLWNMKLGMRLKLSQHHHLNEWLEATGDSIIIEDCTNRVKNIQKCGRGLFWGAAFINGEWFGKNVVGCMWMDLRNEGRKNLIAQQIHFGEGI